MKSALLAQLELLPLPVEMWAHRGTVARAREAVRAAVAALVLGALAAPVHSVVVIQAAAGMAAGMAAAGMAVEAPLEGQTLVVQGELPVRAFKRGPPANFSSRYHRHHHGVLAWIIAAF